MPRGKAEDEDLISLGSWACGEGLLVWGGRELLLEVLSPRGTPQRPLGRGWKELVDTKDNWL